MPPGGMPPGGGWGPPGQTPPPGYPPPTFQPPKKSRTGLYVGLGCGCFLLLGCLAAAGIYYAINSAKPGDEVISTPVTLGQPFTLSYVQQGSQKYAAWLEVDTSHTQGYRLTGTILLSENNTPFGQYTLDEDGNGSPVTERNSSVRWNWTSTSLNGSGSASGKVQLFPLPARTAGGTVTVSGTITGTPGMTGMVRVIITKRD